jgi:hypothetical protein
MTQLAVVLLLLVVALLVVVLRQLHALRARLAARARPPRPPEPHGPRHEPPLRAVPDRVQAEQLSPLLGLRMAGAAADGSSGGIENARSVVWVDHGDEAIFHVDSVRAAIAGELLLVALDLETDQTGRQTLVVPLAIGADEKGGITLACEAAPRGPDLLVRRWGEAALQAVVAAVIELVELHARERAAEPAALHISQGGLQFTAASSTSTGAK